MTRTPIILALAAGSLALAGCDKQQQSASPDTAVNAGPIEPIPAPNGGDWTTVVSQTPEGGFVMGNPDAPVKLIEFGSMTCPHCREFDEEAMGPITDTYVKSGRVSFEFRNFVRDGLDLTASVIARCTGPSGFFGMTRQLYAEQPNWIAKVQAADQSQLQAIDSLPPGQKLPRFAEIAGLKQFAAQRGLPPAKADACLANQAEVDRLVQMQSDATNDFNVNGTPSFAVNGKPLEIEAGTTPWQQVEKKLRDSLGS